MEPSNDSILNEVEIRVLGALIEKQVATPDYYPLTLNALVHACNQTSNRDPVVSYDEQTVMTALDTLRAKNLAYVFYGSESRVPKYKHVVTEIFHLSPAELAVMCVLMLRGPQTTGEIRTRTGRLYEFEDLEKVDETLAGLISRDEAPLVLKLPRQPGRKEARFAHLLGGSCSAENEADDTNRERKPSISSSGHNQTAGLSVEVEALRASLADLKREFEEFKKQFE